jgi:hypothetical protein
LPFSYDSPCDRIASDPQLGFGRPITPIVVPIECVQAPYLVIKRVIGQHQLSVSLYFDLKKNDTKKRGAMEALAYFLILIIAPVKLLMFRSRGIPMYALSEDHV